MRNGRRYAKINVKVLVIIIIITVAIFFSLFVVRQIRRNILSKISLEAGQEAYESKDWVNAYKNFQEYLGRNRDDVEIIKKYAQARLNVRPVENEAIVGAISAYRRVLQLDNTDKEIYEKLAMLYGGIGNYDELAYIARTRLKNKQNDIQAPLWLADAQINVNNFNEAQETLLKLIKDIEKLPDKHDEYVKACLMLSNIIISLDVSPESASKALEWLDKAIEYSPESTEALVSRAKLCYDTPAISGYIAGDRLSVARRDLESADKFGSENPRVLFLLASQWLALGEFDKASAEIQAFDNLPEETLNKYFLDVQDSKVVRFLLASDIAVRRGDITNAVSLIEESLEIFKEEIHRMQLLPSAVKVYTAAGKVTEAHAYLDEYLENIHKLSDTQTADMESSYLKAFVAMAEGKPYLVIDILQPVVANNSSPDLWRLLANAYSQTNQPRRAIVSIMNYLNFYPKDTEMIILLAKENFKMGQWGKAYEAAKNAVSLNPNDFVTQIIRIESGIRLAVESVSNPDKNALDGFSQELSELRLKHPKKENIRILQALIADYLGQPDITEKELKLAIADCNETLNAEMQLAIFYRKNKRIVDAAQIYETAYEKHPDSVKPRLGLSEIYLESSNVELARKCLQEGLDSATLKESKRLFSINLAILNMSQSAGNEEIRKDGIRTLKDIAEQDEQDIEVRKMLLSIPEIQKNPEEVEILINQIKQIEGQAGLWWRLYQARIWLLSEEWRDKQKEISDLLQNCISADPGWSAPVLLMVDLYKKQGDLRRVEEICKQALARNPLSPDIANQLLLLLESQGRFSDAETILRQSGINRRFLDSWEIRMALNTGDIQRAIDELKLRISSDKNDAVSRIQLARLIYQQTKDSTQAFKYLDEAQSITPDSVDITGTKAAILKADGKGEEAIKIMNEYVTAQDNFNAYRLRGMYFENEGEYELAEKDFRKLTTFEDKGASSYELLSNFFARMNQYDKAISAIEEGLVKYSENLSLERRLMKLLVVQGPTRDVERAGQILVKLEEKLPQDSELTKFKAALLMENPTPEAVETAKELLEKQIKLEPADVDAYLMLISITVREAEYDIARNYAIQGLGVNSTNPALMTARSRIELEAGNLEMAVELANLVIQKYPDNKEARDIFVKAAIKSRDKSLLEDAEKMAESAIVSNPNDENMLIARANILNIMGQSEIAIDEMEAYCQKEPGSNSISALTTLAELYRVTGEISKAEQKISQAANINPNDLSVIHSRFLLLVVQKKFDEIPKIVDSYLSAKAQNIRLILDAATILVSLDSQELRKDGLNLFEYAYAIVPDSKDTGFSLASALYKMGNQERAEQIYKEMVDKFPNDIRVLNDYAWILQENHQDYEQALELANKALKLAPDDVHILDTRGTILLKSGNQLDQAKGDFNRIVELSPADSRQQARAFLSLARISVKLNDNAGAKKYSQRALEINQKLNIFTPAEVTEIQENIK